MKKNVSTENVALLTVWNMKFLSVSVRIILFSTVSKHMGYNNNKSNHDDTLVLGVWDSLKRSNTVIIVYTDIWIARETGGMGVET